MLDYVDVDEKCFLLKKDGQKYYLAANKKETISATQNKRYVEKVMVLVAIARPRYDAP